MSDKLTWGPWKSWDPTTALGPPPECTVGALVKADLVMRADRIGKVPDRPAAIRDHIFRVQNGESWALDPPWLRPEDLQSTHLVVRYCLCMDADPQAILNAESEAAEPTTAEEQALLDQLGDLEDML